MYHIDAEWALTFKAKRDLICIQDSVERTSRRTINGTKDI